MGIAVTGCLTTTPPEVADWLVESPETSALVSAPKYGPVRLVNVIVHAPYDTRAMPVLRANGTMAFDAYNRFAATPSQLLRAPTQELLARSGLFKSVLPAASTAPATLGVELEVSRLVLDCREADARRATVKLQLRFVDRTQGELRCVSGTGSVDAASGNYGAAFSEAFAAAFAVALGQVPH